MVRKSQFIILCGPSGCGKSTMGRALAAELGWVFADADHFHSDASIEKMAAGSALSDLERVPWLDRIGLWMTGQVEAGLHAVIACSALKRSYRDRLRTWGRSVQYIYLDASRSDLIRRHEGRTHHFMASSLLDDQIKTFEPLSEDEGALTVTSTGDVDSQLKCILDYLADCDHGQQSESR